MSKKLVLLILPFMLLVGCTNNEEQEKVAYLEYKKELENKETYDKEELLDFDIDFTIEAKDEEITEYNLLINNPKINMNNVKALLIYDFVNEDAFPSVGIFDEPTSLEVGSEDNITLNGDIQTTEDLTNAEFKLYIEYTDDNENVNKVYYKVN